MERCARSIFRESLYKRLYAQRLIYNQIRTVQTANSSATESDRQKDVDSGKVNEGVQPKKRKRYHYNMTKIQRQLSEKHQISNANTDNLRNTPKYQPSSHVEQDHANYLTGDLDPSARANNEETKVLSTEEVEEKFDFLKKSHRRGTERVALTMFGMVRLDSLNKPKKAKKTEVSNDFASDLTRLVFEPGNAVAPGSEKAQDASPVHQSVSHESDSLKSQTTRTEYEGKGVTENSSAMGERHFTHSTTSVSEAISREADFAEMQNTQVMESVHAPKAQPLEQEYNDVKESPQSENRNVFDEQYFEQNKCEQRTVSELRDDHKQNTSKPDDQSFDGFQSLESKVWSLPAEEKSNLFDEQYFSQAPSQTSDESTERLSGDVHLSSAEILDATEPGTTNNMDSASASETKDIAKETSENTTDDIFGITYQPSLESDKIPNYQGSDKKYPIETESVRTVDDANLFDQQYFASTDSSQSTESLDSLMSKEQLNMVNNITDSSNQTSTTKSSKAANEQEKSTTLKQNKIIQETPEESTVTDKTVVVRNPFTVKDKKARQESKANTEKPKTAYDLAMKVRQEKKGQDMPVSPHLSRKWKGKVDSKGFRILSEQVTNVQHLTEEAVVQLLKDSILYEDENIIAIDKPYGLPSHGGPGVHHSIGKLLEPLAHKMAARGSLESLYLVHRLDKETTGVMLLAKTKDAWGELRHMLKKQEIIKKYWTITKGIPNPTEGIIDIPMGEGQVGIRTRMTLYPRIDADTRAYLQAEDLPKKRMRSGKLRHEAITYYKVLDSASQAALVECQPETGVKHQIRCHLCFGLNCPILGDHKYSHISKMAPQKLHPETLQKLGVRQAKVRDIPMHLHAQALVVPNFKDGRNLFISARLPTHFVQNMKWLKLKPPAKK